MIITIPDILSQNNAHLLSLWEKEQCYRFYIKIRRENCTYREIMNLWLRAPYCSYCALSDPFLRLHPPDILGDDWENDVAWSVGQDVLKRLKSTLRKDPEFALRCKGCGFTELRPWEGDEVWVMNYHLEEHYGIPLETPGRIRPIARIRQKIIELYDRACFGCGSSNKRLHIDHILPRSKGGDAAFRNLQPLCKDCGNMKGNDLPDEVDVYEDIYFGPYASDGYEGLFW